MEPGLLTTAGVTKGTIELTICTSLLINFPATHGLKATDFKSPWLSTHAALVSYKEKGPKGHGRTRTDTDRGYGILSSRRAGAIT